MQRIHSRTKANAECLSGMAHRAQMLGTIVASLALFGCTCVKTKIPIHGKIGPYPLETTVDAPIAAYYAETYWRGRVNHSQTDTIPKGQPASQPKLHPARNQVFDQRIDSLHRAFEHRIPDVTHLQVIAANFSVDFASLFWATQLISIPENKSLQIRFLHHLESVACDSTGTKCAILANSSSASDSMVKSEIQNLSDYAAILVPGLDYVNNGHITGSDLKVQRQMFEQVGLHVQFVTIPPMGSVEENAQQIAEAIKNTRLEKVLLGGPSSAGPAIHLALAKYLTPTESQKVKAWVNLGGVLHGSPVVDWVDSPPTSTLWRILLWAKGWDRAAISSLRSDVSRERAATLNLPPHIKTINYIGLSLSGNISKFAMDKYCIMKKLGPNDGLALLPEMVAPHSVTLLAPTSDHFSPKIQ